MDSVGLCLEPEAKVRIVGHGWWHGARSRAGLEESIVVETVEGPRYHRTTRSDMECQSADET